MRGRITRFGGRFLPFTTDFQADRSKATRAATLPNVNKSNSLHKNQLVNQGLCGFNAGLSSPCQESFTDRSQSNHRVQLAIIKANYFRKALDGVVILIHPFERSAAHHGLFL
jgi:hypothetical protein